jgi:DNA-binding CsgD family transcriptional regulator
MKQQGRPSGHPGGLTQREVEVLRLIGSGKSNREIAEQLAIAEGSVRRHVNNIYNKTGATNRTEAGAYAFQQGLVGDTFTALAENLTPRRANTSWVWNSPRVKAILERPKGTPIDLSGLTEAERDALFKEAKGMWADHPEIKDSVEWVRGLREGLSKSFQ